jgi:hypothetical protein
MGWLVMSDHWPLASALVTPATALCDGLAAGPIVSLMIDPGAAVPENSG